MKIADAAGAAGAPGAVCGGRQCRVARADLRCNCGNLLARRVKDGVELKCRRCKRTIVLPLSEG